MQNLVPQFILEKHAAAELSGQMEVASLFVDISGFSAVTNALAQYGSEAAEVMADVMKRVFEPLVDAIYAQGGFITTFAGDGFTALFSSRENRLEQADHLRALAAAQAVQTHMTSHPVQETPYGHFPFAVKLGLGSGRVDWGILQPGDEQVKTAYYFSGPAVEAAAAAEHDAQPGNIILSPAVAGVLSGAVRLLPVGANGNRRMLTLMPGITLPAAATLALPQAYPGEADFVPQIILQHGAAPAAADAPLSDSGSERGEFRQVVSLFINLMSVRGREDLTPFIAAVFALQRQYGGYLTRVDFGDKGCNLLLFWGTPTTTEKDLENALQFVLALGEHTPGSYKAGVTYRMMYAGLAGSERRGEWTCYGEGVNYAARLMVAAPWGSIWLDERVANRAGGQFVIEKIGERNFKGFAQPQPVYALLERTSLSNITLYQGEMAGREAELARLHEFIRPLAARDGKRFAGIMVIEGEPGLGKSRLAAEFARQITAPGAEGQPALAQWAVCQTDQTVRASLNPFRYWLCNYFGQSPSESIARNKRSFGRGLDQLIAATQDEALQQELNRGRSFLGALLELYWDNSLYGETDPEGRYELTFTAIKNFILAESLRQPLALNIEDAQYLDEDSLAFLQRLLNDIEAYPLAILATARPRAGQTPLFEHLPYERLELGPINSAEMHLLAQRLLGGPPDERLARLVVARSEGNPFFAEQILLYLSEGEAIEPGPDGCWQLTRKRPSRSGADGADALPTDVRLVFAARLDRLVQEVKELVQTASVLGREFDVQVLAHMMHHKPELPEQLRHAEEDAIWQAINQVRYLFRHALLRDAAYEMQLRSRRRELHHLAAQSLEQLYAQEIELHLDKIAYHYEAAFQQGLEVARQPAYQYLERAGQRAAQAYENTAALDFFSRALSLLKESEADERFALLLLHEAVLHLVEDRNAQAADLDAAQALADAWQRPGERAEVALRRAQFANLTGNYAAAIEQARHAATFAQAAGQIGLEAAAQLAWGEAVYRMADYPAAIQLLEQAHALAQAAGHGPLEVRILLLSGNIALNQGNYEVARQQYTQALAAAQQANIRRSEGNAQVVLGNVALRQGQYPLARQHYHLGLSIARQVGDRASESKALNNLGLAAHRQGDYAAASQSYQQGLQIARQMGDRAMESKLLSNLGDVLDEQADYTAARNYHTQSLQIARQIGNRQSEGISLGNLGINAHRQGDYAAAQEYLEQGLLLFRQIGNRWAEAVGLIHLGEVAFSRGDIPATQQYYTQSLELTTQLGDLQKQGEAHNGLGQVAFRQSDYATAQQHYAQSLELALRIGDRTAEGKTRHNMGRCAMAQDQVEQGRACFQQALALHQELKQPPHIAENLAALAALAWQSGAENETRAHLEALLPILAANPGLDGAQQPQHAILEVVCLMEDMHDGRAAAILADAQVRLRDRAAALPDDAARLLFLEGIPENLELLARSLPPAFEQAAQPIPIPPAAPMPISTPTPVAEAPAPAGAPSANAAAPSPAPAGDSPQAVQIKSLDQAGLARWLDSLNAGAAPGIQAAPGVTIVIHIEHMTIENLNFTGTPLDPAKAPSQTKGQDQT